MNDDVLLKVFFNVINIMYDMELIKENYHY